MYVICLHLMSPEKGKNPNQDNFAEVSVTVMGGCSEAAQGSVVLR